jgi:diguanylate cyclase (GGDEF)-like protein
MTGICVVDDAAIVLFLLDEAGAAAAAKLSRGPRDSAAGSFSYELAGQDLSRRLPRVVPEAGVRRSRVDDHIEQARERRLCPIAAFKTIFFPMIALALFVVALLSVTQVRRTLGPLEKLIEGTRRAGERDFSARVDVRSDDEFGELASSFNSMASRLGGQFTALLTLADIDHAILSRLDLDRVAETVVTRMRDIVPADYVSIVIVDRNAPEMACVYTRDQRGEHAVGLARCAFAAQDTVELLAHPDGIWLERARAQGAFLAPILALGAASLLVLPIVWQQAVVGTVILGFDGAPLLTEEERTRARNLGDRVGVAFATVAKDEQLYYQANYDVLTGLPNRLFFKDQLGRRLAQSEREPQPFALLFIDLDQFKNVNDSLGHSAGDDVLRQAAERLKRCVRDVDTVTRLGGDEFTIILSDIRSHRDPERVAEHVLEAMKRPFTVAGNEHYLNASIGIAVHPSDGISSDELLRNADTAMYRAKETGRGRYVYFEERMNIAAIARLNLERDMRKALERGEFRVWYQPQLDIRTGRLSGAEALLRWDSPDHGLRLPAEFIAVAEDSGLIEPIGQWVLREACRQFVAWQREGLDVPHIAVNVSARQFRQKGFVDSIASTLRDTGIDAKCLELEITESLLIDAKSSTAGLLEACRRMGITIGLDDFGTGYSSLAYLKRFPVNTVKIDRSFVTDLGTSKDAGAIAAAVIAMAHALDKRVVAEGVETQAQADILSGLDCDHIQGYFYSAPLPATMFASFAVTARRLRPGGSDSDVPGRCQLIDCDARQCRSLPTGNPGKGRARQTVPGR